MQRTLSVFAGCVFGFLAGRLIGMRVPWFLWWVGPIAGGVFAWIGCGPIEVAEAVGSACKQVLPKFSTVMVSALRRCGRFCVALVLAPFLDVRFAVLSFIGFVSMFLWLMVFSALTTLCSGEGMQGMTPNGKLLAAFLLGGTWFFTLVHHYQDTTEEDRAGSLRELRTLIRWGPVQVFCFYLPRSVIRWCRRTHIPFGRIVHGVVRVALITIRASNSSKRMVCGLDMLILLVVASLRGVQAPGDLIAWAVLGGVGGVIHDLALRERIRRFAVLRLHA